MKERRHYTVEFKREAARLLIIDGLSTGEVLERLGLNKNMLNRWKQDHLTELGSKREASSVNPNEMSLEIDRLRKELAKSQRMNEILKKRWATSAGTTDAISFYTGS